MTAFWILTIGIFLVLTFILNKIFYKDARGDTNRNKKLWKLWGMRNIYWALLLFVSSGLTIVIVLILKWANMLPIIGL